MDGTTQEACALWEKETDEERWWKMPESVPVEMVHGETGWNDVKNALEGASACGLDAEWKPGTGEAALLQLAIRSQEGAAHDKVFLLDLLALPSDKMQGTIRTLLTNKRVLKIGFDLEGDLRMVASSLGQGGWSCVSFVEPYMDIRKTTARLAKYQPNLAEPLLAGLSPLVEVLLGMPLDKTQQCSDWRARPLHHMQVEYAANDAYCLLAMADELCLRCESADSSIETAVEFRSQLYKVLVVNPRRKHSRRGRRKEKKERKDEFATTVVPWQIPPSIENVKFLCAEMVEGLARQLRLCGIDAESGHGKSIYALVEKAEAEGRVLLTQDRMAASGRYTRSVYYVFSQRKQEQLQEILQQFELVVPEARLLSRCVHCNGRLHENPLTPSEAEQLPQDLPPKVFEDHQEFWCCERCSHVYWEGSAYRRAFAQFSGQVQRACM